MTHLNAPRPPLDASHRGPSRILLAVTVLVVAANLRPAITALGPVLDMVRSDTGLSEAALGFLGALPVLTFGIVSPLVHYMSAKFGVDRTVFGALLLLVAGTVIRSLPGFSGWLWLGTVLLAAAIAVGNVLMPVVVKRDFPAKVSLMTGVYAACLSGVAAVASGISVPVAEASSWELALGIWAVPALIAAGAWALRLRATSESRGLNAAAIPEPPAPTSSMWRSAVAWQVAMVMALQSSVFYLLVTWLPTIEAEYGFDAHVAGWHMFAFQLVGIVAGLMAGQILHRSSDQRAIGAITASVMVIAMLGFVMAPQWALAWSIVAGFSAGAALVVTLTLMSVRARTPREAGRLSGMSQSVGYLIGSLGPIIAGLMFELTGSWTPVLLFAATLAAVQAVVSLFAGRDRFTHAHE